MNIKEAIHAFFATPMVPRYYGDKKWGRLPKSGGLVFRNDGMKIRRQDETGEVHEYSLRNRWGIESWKSVRTLSSEESGELMEEGKT